MSIHHGTEASAPAGTAIVIDGTTVKTPGIPAFYAYTVAGGSKSTVGIIPFNATLINNGGHYNTSTYKFTAPIAGIYHFTGNILKYNTAVTEIAFYKNDIKLTARADGYSNTGNINTYKNIPLDIRISLNLGDTIDVRVEVAGPIYFGENLSHFKGYLIG